VRNALHSGAVARIIGLHEAAHPEFEKLELAELVGRESSVVSIAQAFAVDVDREP